MTMLTVLEEVAAERLRQNSKGYDRAHDDAEGDGQLVLAACCYALEGSGARCLRQENIVGMGLMWIDAWPWVRGGDRRHLPDYRQRLIIAMAMLGAEVERLDRADAAAAADNAAPVTAGEGGQPA